MQINHEFVAIGFPTETGAAEVAATLAKAIDQELIDIEDASIAVRSADGEVMIDPFGERPAAGTVGGTLAGMVAGTLLAMPIAGAMFGGVSGAAIGALTDAGIEEGVAEDLGKMMKPGSSALFVLVNRAHGDRGIATLKKYGGTLLHTTLPEWKEEKLREALQS